MSDPSATETPKRVFVVACRRSGTTWLTLLLAQQRGVLGVQQSSYFHRLDYFAKYFDEEVTFGRHVLARAPQDAAPAGELERTPVRSILPSERVDGHLRPLTEEVYRALGASVPGTLALVDHQPENVRTWERILAVFPDAWFLHVIRDPRSVFASYVHSARTWSDRRTFPTDPLVFANEWKRDLAEGLRLGEATERYLEVRYEDLRARGPEELARVRAFLGLPAEPAECEAAIDACRIDRLQGSSHGPRSFFRKGQAASWREDLSRGAIQAVEHHCAGQMDALGYERELHTGDGVPLAVRVQGWARWARNRLRGRR